MDLWEAAQNGDDKTVAELLLKPEIDVNYSNENERSDTVLIISCRKNRLSTVKLLLADPRINFFGMNVGAASALFIARQEGHKEVIQALLNHIEDPLSN